MAAAATASLTWTKVVRLYFVDGDLAQQEEESKEQELKKKVPFKKTILAAAEKTFIHRR